MIVYLDQGNSAIKWRVESEGALLKQGRSEGSDLTNLLAEFDALTGESEGLPEVWVSNVAGAKAEMLLKNALTQLGVSFPRFVKVQRQFAGLTVAYEDISQLGVDRWLAMLAARESAEVEVLVISAGTAITVDKIDAGGRHLGGLIAPGWSMLKDVVQSNTADIDIVFGEMSGARELGAGRLGKSTLECLSLGVSAMMVSFIECAIAQFGLGCSRKLMTGGFASVLNALTGNQCRLAENLVLDGLRVARNEHLLRGITIWDS